MMYLEEDSIGQHEDRLNSIIDPGKSTAVTAYTTTHRTKIVNVDQIKHIFIVWVLPTKSLFTLNIKKTCCTQHIHCIY